MIDDTMHEKIEEMIISTGIREHNILDGCSETQIKVWLRWAVLGQSEKEIIDELFYDRKDVTLSVIKNIINRAQLNIVSNLLYDCNVNDWFEDHPATYNAIVLLIKKLRERRKHVQSVDIKQK